MQRSPTLAWREIAKSRLRHWMVSYAAAFLGRPVEFWYDQFLAKPPRDGAVTYWHQDEGYWGRNLEERGITCWMPLHDVDPAPAVLVPLAAGGAILHHCRTLHSSGPNTSDHVRRAYANEWQMPPVRRDAPRPLPWVDAGKRAWESRQMR